jgi:hypothetical protein
MDWVCKQASDSRCNRRGLAALALFTVLCLSFLPRPAFAAGGGGGGASDSVVLTTEALEESNQETHPVSGRTTSELVTGRIHLNDFVLLSGPALNNLSGNVPGPPGPPPGAAPGASHSGHSHGSTARVATASGAPYQFTPGYSMRDNIEGSYAVSDRFGVGPVFGIDHRFYGNHSTTLGDPQIRANLKQIYDRDFDGAEVDAGTWISYTVPTSGMSRAVNSYGALSISLIPRLMFHGSRFFMSAVLGGSISADGEPGHAMPFTPWRLTSGVQGNYRFSRRWTVFLGNTESLSGGPTAPIQYPDDLPDPSMAYASQQDGGVRENHPYHFATGAYFRVSEGTSLSPRLSWDADQNINTTTFGFSANFSIL